MMPKEDYSYLSSRLVKEVFALGGDLTGLVPGRSRCCASACATARRAGLIGPVDRSGA